MLVREISFQRQMQEPAPRLPEIRSRAKVEHLEEDQRMSDDICDLTAKECVPCRGGVPPLAGDELARLSRQLGHDWKVVESHHLEKEFAFPDFKSALAFTNRVGALAESEGHHPDIYLAWGKVRIAIFTHKIDGLTESDFILAAKAEQLPR
jgi:4a-hydroxytetrahydrobiopterin dehydratase